MSFSWRLGIWLAVVVLVCGCKPLRESTDTECVGTDCVEDPPPKPPCEAGEPEPMEVSFAEPQVTAVAGSPSRVTAADFNADGSLDLAIVDVKTYAVLFFPGDGAGSFGEPVSLAAADRLANDVSAADVDGDGHDDLLVANVSDAVDGDFVVGSAAIRFGGPAFPEAPLDLRAPVGYGYTDSVTAGDFDADGEVDIASGWGSAGGFVTFNEGNRSFTDGAPLEVAPILWDVHAADLDGKGRAAITGLNPQAQGWVVYRAADDRTFSRESVGGLLFPGELMDVIDLDGDGRPELLEAGLDDVGVVAWNDGTGHFADHTPLCVAEEGAGPAVPIGIGAGDFDGDGRRDIVVANSRLDGLAFLGGTSTRLYRLPRLVPTGTPEPGDLVIADFNGDGKPDVVSVHPDDEGFVLLLNTK